MGVRNGRGMWPGRTFAAGFTLIEALAALLILSLLLIGAWTLLAASSRAYDDMVWQNRVNAEARQAIEDICDTVRISGQDQDLIRQPAVSAQPQIIVPPAAQSTASLLSGLSLPSGTRFTYTVQPSPTTGEPELTRQFQYGTLESAARFIVSVHFDYEYRTPTLAADLATDGRWQMQRLADLGSWNGTNPYQNPANLVSVVYVTVTAQATSYVGGPTYQRTLRSAVHLRGPYNVTAPPALTGP